MSLGQPTNQKGNELQRHIENDVVLCTKLLDLLTQEQEALKNRDIDRVESILEEKVPMLDALDQSAKARQQWIASVTASASEGNEGNLNTFFDKSADSGLRQRWEQLKSLYSDIRNQNEVNGKLLSRHQGTLNRLLDIMRGKTSAPSLYNASGYSSASAQSNNFGEA